jgi:hypothetical protein
MRLFQNVGMYPSYLEHLNILAKSSNTFKDRMEVFLSDRYGACHILLPVLQGEKSTFFTNSDDQILQAYWAVEHGMSKKSSMEDILLAQIEQHRSEIFYNLNPMRYGKDFLKKLPGCVKKKIAWRAAPSANLDLGIYNLLLCNFPSILESYKKAGWHASYFCPAHDPKMNRYATNKDRPIDILFVGGYSRHHKRRAEMLTALAVELNHLSIRMHLDCSKLTKFSESFLGYLLPIYKYKRPDVIINISKPPVFGLDLYEAISRSKIVINGAVDMAGKDRGNMRCFEAMGCGSLLISDEGNYPFGMVNGKTMLTYNSLSQLIYKIDRALVSSEYLSIANNGFLLMQTKYNKKNQWLDFLKIIGSL